MEHKRVQWEVMRFFDLPGFLIGIALIGLFLAGYYGVQKWPEFEFKMAVRSIVACAREQDLVCARPIVRDIIAKRSGAAVIDALSRELRPMSCHYLGHVVGQEQYFQAGDIEVAMARCNRQCDSACIHGVIGGAFAEELGITDLDDIQIDLQHLGEGEVLKIGERLCTNPGTCHGVGHTLFQIYEDFQPAFDICRSVAGEWVGMCYNGVVMEYADMLSARNTNVEQRVEYPTEEELPVFCDFPTIAEARSCFRYMPRIVVNTLAQKGVSEEDAITRMMAICDAHESAERRTVCYAGFGSYGSYTIITGMENQAVSCERFTDTSAREACIVGRVGVATEDRKWQLARYCASTGEHAPVCYQALFFFLNRVGVPRADQEVLCPENDTACAAGLANNTIDSVSIPGSNEE